MPGEALDINTYDRKTVWLDVKKRSCIVDDKIKYLTVNSAHSVAKPVRKVISSTLPTSIIPIRRSRAEAQRRQGMFDLAMGVGRIHALIQTSFEEGAAAKTVAESRFDVSAFPIPPLRLCVSPSHPDPESRARSSAGWLHAFVRHHPYNGKTLCWIRLCRQDLPTPAIIASSTPYQQLNLGELTNPQSTVEIVFP